MNRKRIGLILVAMAVVLGAAAAWPFVMAKTERIVIDDAVRAETFKGENFAKLSDGYTRYFWAGPEDGQVVVFVHGFSSPCVIWEKQVDALAAAGYRVLRYDLFGRGHSDRPYAAYDADFYHRQLVELLDNQNVTQPVHIIGLSMGGPITLRFVDREPERVRSFGLVAPAGFGANIPAIAQVLRVPGIAEWAIQAFGDRIMLKSVDEMFSDPVALATFRAAYEEQLQYAGYKRALLHTLRNHQMLGLDDLYARVGKAGKPAILFWGDKDTVVPYANAEKVCAAIPAIEFHTIPAGGHTPNYEYPELFNAPLVAFLKKQESPAPE